MFRKKASGQVSNRYVSPSLPRERSRGFDQTPCRLFLRNFNGRELSGTADHSQADLERIKRVNWVVRRGPGMTIFAVFRQKTRILASITIYKTAVSVELSPRV
jgi:hypothetical protein